MAAGVERVADAEEAVALCTELAGLAITLGSGIGEGLNSQVDGQVETKVSACLSRGMC